MRQINALHINSPSEGSWLSCDVLAAESYRVSPLHVSTLIARLDADESRGDQGTGYEHGQPVPRHEIYPICCGS